MNPPPRFTNFPGTSGACGPTLTTIPTLPALHVPDQPVTALVEDADLVASGQDQQDLCQPVRSALAGDQLGDQRPQQPGVEPIEWGTGIEYQDAADVEIAGQGRHRLVIQIAAEEGREGIV